MTFKLWALAVPVVAAVFSFLAYDAAYRRGQVDALRGVYRLTQPERDAADPDGLRHHLATTREAGR